MSAAPHDSPLDASSPGDPEFLEVRLDSISVTNVGFILFLRIEDAGEGVESKRVLPIFIGQTEAQAIAQALNDEPPARPLTHDLMKTVLDSLEIAVTRVEITDLREGTFHGRIHLLKDGIEPLEYDARPSDAIALALRSQAPIFAARAVFEAAAVTVSGAPPEGASSVENAPRAAESGESSGPSDPEERPLSPAEKLRLALDEAVREERYEDAARLRDAIDRQKREN